MDPVDIATQLRWAEARLEHAQATYDALHAAYLRAPELDAVFDAMQRAREDVMRIWGEIAELTDIRREMRAYRKHGAQAGHGG